MTVMAALRVTVARVLSRTVTVNVHVHAPVAVPVMTPVALLSTKPLGRAPVVTVNVYGAFPPDTAKGVTRLLPT